MKQTAVEFYEIEINSLIEKYEAKEISEREFITMKHNLFYKAKELEKQQQGYSEEEVINILMSMPVDSHTNIIEWFNKFKNK